MVNYPDFKIIAKGSDITDKIRQNLIEVGFEDKEGNESDEISIRVHGIYAKATFGDSLELWLGFAGKLWRCGSFSVQTCERNYKEQTTEIRATAVNFASPIKSKKTRTWQNTDLFKIASTIASENGLKLVVSGTTQNIASRLQDNVSDLDFLYTLCFEMGYLMAVKDNSLIITPKDGKIGVNSTNITPKNNALPQIGVSLNECFTLSITEANRHAYSGVVVQWHDSTSGKTKSIKVGNGDSVTTMRIPEPKSDSEAYKRGESKLNELQRGGVSGALECGGREIKAGAKLHLSGVYDYENTEFSIKKVSHRLNATSFITGVEFEG